VDLKLEHVIRLANRFSTGRMADLIVVMDAGRVQEVGSHEELLAAGGRHADLFRAAGPYR
jgi:ATP-binding cassette, subfamily B, bacterial